MSPSEVLTGPVTQDILRIQKDRAIWGSFRNLVGNADTATRDIAGPFIAWVMFSVVVWAIGILLVFVGYRLSLKRPPT